MTTTGASPLPFFENGALREDEVLGLELEAWGLAAILDAAEEEVGPEAVDTLFDTWGVDARALMRSHAWVRFEFAERFMDGLAALCGPEVIQRAGWRSMTPRYLGPLYPLVRAIGTVESTYERIVNSAPRYNKARKLVLENTGPRKATLRFERANGSNRPKTRHFCHFCQAQIEAVPVVFGLPPARVIESQCMVDGAPSCEFQITWEASPTRWPRWASWVLGALVAGGSAWMARAAELPWPAIVALAATTGSAALFAVVVRRQYDEINARVASMNEYREGLTKSVRANEDRFAELLQAKLEVDAKVEERTADLERTSARLAETLDEVQALDRAKTDFFSNVSHELRTPLTLLMSPLEHMARGEEPPGGRAAALDAMQRNARRLLTMINQLLDLARSESGEATLERVPIALEDFVSALKTSFDAAAVAKSVALEFDATQANTVVALDPRWLETALTNLLANGLRFSDAGGKLRLHVEDTGDEVVFEVSDEGPGIAAEDRKNLFERFARGSSSRSGTGLGLALVAQAARLHGGRIEVSSEVEQGATFRLHLPRVLAEGEAVALRVDEQIAEPGEPAVPESRVGPDATAPLALVVEDNSDVRRFVCDVLAARYRVSSAVDGRAGLALAREEPPDVIVSDVAMPEMDGLEFTRAVREDPAIRDVPIVLVTARGEPEQILAGFDAGAQDYVTKPFHGRELLARTDALVRARRLAGRFAHRERLAMLGITAASVAHHIRNPLNALIAGLPAVQRRIGGDFDESTKRMFDVFIDCASRIERVTSDLLDLSRVDRESEGRYAPGRGLQACVRLMETRFGDGLQLALDIDEKTEVIGRAGDMHSVFLNLLDNAARAVEANGRVRVTGRRVEDEYEIRVADAGGGVPEALKERIFEAFVTTRTGGEGTGLGLAIARDVATQHGGTITVEDSDLGGAEFIIRVPIAC